MTDDDDLVFYDPFNIVWVILRQWKDDNERLCVMEHCTVMSWISTTGEIQMRELVIKSQECWSFTHLYAQT